MTDDLRRARIDREPRPAQTPAGALVTHPAFVGKVTSRAGAANRTYFRVRPQVIGGPEVEGGAGTNEDVGATDILVLPTGLPPAVGALVPVTWVRDRWVTRTTQAAGCHGRLIVSVSGCAADTELFAGATVTVSGPAPATTPVATGTLIYGIHPTGGTYAAFAVVEVPADGTYTVTVAGLPAGYAALDPWTAAVAGCKDTVTGKAACNDAAQAKVSFSVCSGVGSLAGATATLSGGVEGSGTTDAGGVATFPVAVPADGDCTAGPLFVPGVTITITPPAGLGVLPYAGPWALGTRGFSRCGDNDFHALVPDDDHICLCPCAWPLPKVLTYSDPYGTATLTYDEVRGYWHGTYAVDCGCVLDDPPVWCPPDPYGVEWFGRTTSNQAVPMLVVLHCVRGTVSVLKLPPTSDLPAECHGCGDPYRGGPGPRPLGYIARTLPPGPGGFIGGVLARDINLTCPEQGVPTLIVGTFDSKARLGWTLACFDGPFSIMP